MSVDHGMIEEIIFVRTFDNYAAQYMKIVFYRIRNFLSFSDRNVVNVFNFSIPLFHQKSLNLKIMENMLVSFRAFIW